MKASNHYSEVVLGAELILLKALADMPFEEAKSADTSEDVKRLALAEVRETLVSPLHPQRAEMARTLHNLRILLQALEAITEPGQFEQWKESVKPVIEHIEGQANENRCDRAKPQRSRRNQGMR